ncbi:prolipoprotein diacylglyceryl transferase, partial [Patescibacteria group bacterium]|nr:prolipoprotein diacylglyceryl transferase [Patescibacteria group bacterium]
MIPYIELHQFIVFGITLYAWGILVSLGFFVGLLVAKMHAKKHGLDDKKMIDLAFWILLASIIGGRIGHIPYAFEWYLKEPLNIFRMWDGGMSVFGGFIGALFATVIFLKIKKLPFWGYASSAIFGLPFGLWIGRIGCFLIHDHPGL